MIVVDASVAVEVLLQLEAADALMDRLFSGGESLHAPELLDVEVAQVIWSASTTSARAACRIGVPRERSSTPLRPSACGRET